MAKHGKANQSKSENRTYKGTKFSEMTAGEKVEELVSSLSNPKQYAKDNFTSLKAVKPKHKK